MKKKLLSAALAVAMALSMVPGAFAAEAVTASPTNDKLTVDGVERNPTVYKIGDSNYFKIRDLAAVLNGTSKQFSVGYDGEKQSVTATPGQPYELTGTELTGAASSSQPAQASSDAIYVNGQRVEAEVYKIDGSNYFKLRDLGAALGFEVNWTAERGVFLETGEKRDSVYEFLADYITTHGEMETDGDFKGQYTCYLGVLGFLGTDNDLINRIYADPDTGLITLSAIGFTNYSGKYSTPSMTSCSLELSPEGGPYRGSFSSSTLKKSWTGTVTYETEDGTFQIDPASFTSQTGALSFDSYDTNGSSNQSSAEKNSAVIVKNWMKAVRDGILKPNGYTLSDLGFTRF